MKNVLEQKYLDNDPITYVLQKDLPEAKCNSEYVICNEESYYVSYDFDDPDVAKHGAWIKSVYSKVFIENHPQWFKLKEEEKDGFGILRGVGIEKGDIVYFKFAESTLRISVADIKSLSFLLGDILDGLFGAQCEKETIENIYTEINKIRAIHNKKPIDFFKFKEGKKVHWEDLKTCLNDLKKSGDWTFSKTYLNTDGKNITVPKEVAEYIKKIVDMNKSLKKFWLLSITKAIDEKEASKIFDSFFPKAKY